ncbi:MAG TPA: sugar phosphate isomerase/epimerase [Chthoniobacterales bacterium]|nr:sugar phosphate isomerase/epimerase [Chthoniobacterales bacterium]
MQLAIFAKTFQRSTLAQTLDAVVAHGFDGIQFNFSCAGLPPMPEAIPADVARSIAREIQKRKLSVAAVSGTFNTIHPDPEKRKQGLRRLAAIAEVCRPLGASAITLCTGTRDVESMWRHHAQNSSMEAWRDLVTSLSEALEITESFNVTLGIEPETANVIDSARKARKLLDEMKSPRLKIVMDAANLFHAGDEARMKEVIDEAFDLLAGDIIAAHAKDFRVNDGAIEHVAAGKGILDYDLYLSKLREARFTGPLILHGLEETEVAGSRRVLQDALAGSGRAHDL